MGYETAPLSFWTTVKCKDCQYVGEQYMTSYEGIGMYRFSYCNRVVSDCTVVDPDVDRECGYFAEREVSETGGQHGLAI